MADHHLRRIRMNRAGDITITVNKDTLLGVLKHNRESHSDVYEKAFEGYCKLMRTELENRLVDIKASKAIDPFLRHNAPEDHTEDYNDVIEMLEMAVDDEIELTQAQFKQYVKDNWGWKQSWETSNTEYLQA
jgi:hypothetical protein